MIRTATADDLEELYQIERVCFSQNEAATRAQLSERLKIYPNHFILLIKDDKIVSFINGFITNDKDLSDEMYENANLHDENGDWQMIFGVNTLPTHRRNGYARMLIEKTVETAKKEKRLGVVLTCKKQLVSYYSKFRFVDEGISESKHG